MLSIVHHRLMLLLDSVAENSLEVFLAILHYGLTNRLLGTGRHGLDVIAAEAVRIALLEFQQQLLASLGHDLRRVSLDPPDHSGYQDFELLALKVHDLGLERQ